MTSIIAECCQNHNGDYGLLKEMTYAAAEAGADYVKIQTIFADRLSFRPQFQSGLMEDEIVKVIKRPFEPEYERMKGLELTREQMSDFVALCGQLNVRPLTTCFTRQDVNMIKELGFNEIKVASYDCASFQMIRELKPKFGRLIVSTGASYDDEIEKCASLLEGADYALLHCVSVYPTPLRMANINRLQFLKKFNAPVGFSDHSSNIGNEHLVASAAAIHYGADILERHFTILDSSASKDGPVSISTDDISWLKMFSKQNASDQIQSLDHKFADWRRCLGSEQRSLSDDELLNRDYYRGRFCSKFEDSSGNKRQVFNWEESEICEA